jgi:hypothetical protein
MSKSKTTKLAPILLAILSIALTVTTLAAITTPQDDSSSSGIVATTSKNSDKPTSTNSPSNTNSKNAILTPTNLPTTSPPPSSNPSSASPTVVPSSNLDIYADSACINALNTISWGLVPAGANSTLTAYIKNTGTTPTTLSLATSAWSPTNATNYITVSWDKQGATLNAGQSIAATITLTVSPSIIGITTFSNTITITGTN